MSIEDQDEEVEEEEEFHEVDEEKHKTSQESVSSYQNRSPSVLKQDVSNQRTTQNDQQQCSESPGKKIEDIQVDGGNVEKPELEALEKSTPTTTATPTLTSVSEPKESGVNDDPKIEDSSTPQADSNASQPETTKSTLDWADIMLSSVISSNNSGEDSHDSESHSSESHSNETAHAVKSSSADNTMDEIVAITKEKLHINDEPDTGSLTQKLHDSNLESNQIEAGDTIPAPLDDNEEHKRGVEGEDPVRDHEKSNSNEQNKTLAEEAGDKVGDAGGHPEDTEKKELDMDEDVKNPQYIPKKGIFYEHDDRSHDVEVKPSPQTTTTEEGGEASKTKDAGSSKKTSVQEKQNDNRRNNNRRQRTDADRWNHDLFRDDRQKPKSKSELINAYGYDIRQERSAREQVENRSQRGQEDHRSRAGRDVKPIRQNRSENSRERRPRRQNPRMNNRNDNPQIQPKRDTLNARPTKPDVKDARDLSENKQPSQNSSYSANRRNREPPKDGRNVRNDRGGKRRSSRDPPQTPAEDKPQQTSTIMPPITVWTNEDTANAENFKESPPMIKTNVPSASQPQQHQQPQRGHSGDWDQGQSNKGMYQDKPNREENRHNNPRSRYQDRSDSHRLPQSQGRNQWNDRSNQHYTEWHRANNYGKTNDYIVKTQTFENSRLSQQANLNRSNERDLREVLNARRVNVQQPNFQMKVQSGPDQHIQQRGAIQSRHMHNQYAPSHHMVQHHQHPPQHLVHHHQTQFQQPQQHTQLQHQQGQQQPQQRPSHQQQHQPQQAVSQQQQAQPAQQVPTLNSTHQTPSVAASTQQGQNQRPKPESQPSQARQNNLSGNGQELNRAGSAVTNVSDILNSRPIIKTDSYTSTGVPAHQQPAQSIPHSQNHRTMGGPMVQQAPNHVGAHMMPSHLGAGGGPSPYYPSNNTRDPTGGPSLATAYHGYIPGAHSIVDTTRYHMTTQQLSEHGYMNPAGQANVPPASVLHQQGMYADATQASGTVASSAYLAQAGSTLSPNTNIPVTGAGPPPIPPVSYLQHSQYPPPPYSNPYSHQPQHNQAPTQTSHAYPYWSYIQ